MGCSRQEYWSGVAIHFSRGSSRLRDQTWVSCIAGRRFYRLLSQQGRRTTRHHDTHITPLPSQTAILSSSVSPAPMSKHKPLFLVSLVLELSCMERIFRGILFVCFLAVLGLHCWAQGFTSGSEQKVLVVAMWRRLTAVASLVAEHGL